MHTCDFYLWATTLLKFSGHESGSRFRSSFRNVTGRWRINLFAGNLFLRSISKLWFSGKPIKGNASKVYVWSVESIIRKLDVDVKIKYSFFMNFCTEITYSQGLASVNILGEIRVSPIRMLTELIRWSQWEVSGSLRTENFDRINTVLRTDYEFFLSLTAFSVAFLIPLAVRLNNNQTFVE